LVELGREPEGADQVVRNVNFVFGTILGIMSGLAILKKRRLLGILIAPFAALMLAIGSGFVREQ
jgi:hypothetical protein